VRLAQAFGVTKGQVVSLVGAGGKTTLMYRLAAELVEAGWQVLTTTTTHIRPPQSGQTPHLIVESDGERVASSVERALRRFPHVTLASRRLESEDKLVGVPLVWIPVLQGIADVVIVEADGARGRSAKAPAAHEPVIPIETSILAPVVGVDCIGMPLSAEVAHRPEIVARLTGTECGDAISPAAVGRLISHPLGGLKGMPERCRAVPVLNKVHDAAAMANARTVAEALKSNRDIHRVLITAATSVEPVLECWRKTTAVVLAAGGAVRYGATKQLLTIGQTTMIEHVIAQLRGSWVDDVVVVVGHEAERVAQHVPSSCRVAVNEHWAEGISSSIRVGLGEIGADCEAVIFVLADQPNLDSQTVNRLLSGFYTSDKSIVVPTFSQARGTPVLFERSRFDDLAALSGDVGGRAVIARFPSEVKPVEVASPSVFLDVDTPEDYERYCSTHAVDR
jgi:molybdenum cofactor cytidylyltransferase